MQNNQNSTFQYTYSAREQAEIRRIREKYAPRQESKLERLQRLDASVTQKATVTAISVGVAGTLVMGAGMSCCLAIGGAWFIPGIIIGVAGMAVISAAYPLYTRVMKRERERIAPEILRLTDELMK